MTVKYTLLYIQHSHAAYQEVSNSSSTKETSFVTTLGNAKLTKVGGVLGWGLGWGWREIGIPLFGKRVSQILGDLVLGYKKWESVFNIMRLPISTTTNEQLQNC